MNQSTKKRVFRQDVQALRALAVWFVIGVHLFPSALRGGFIGVDVFFVISGFLITTHLWKELQAKQRISFGRFYARRIRRLLPAAFFVIAFSLLGVYLLVPLEQYAHHLREIAASAGYVQNLYLAQQAVDYHAQGMSASVAQHYWSLSVEEQFYLLWPALLMLFAGGLKGFRKLKSPANLATLSSEQVLWRRVTWGIGVFAVVFFLFNLWFTNYSLQQAYFFTPVRFWEFAFGAIVALLSVKYAGVFWKGKTRLRAFICYLSWIILVFSGFWISPEWAFPGYVALLPVTATALIILCGLDNYQLPGASWLINTRIIQYFGDISYSLYLWHWPLLILAPFLVGADRVHFVAKIIIALLTIVLAGLSKRFIEDPGQRLNISTLKTFMLMLISVSILVGGCLYSDHRVKTLIAENAQKVEQKILASEKEQCTGPNALFNKCDREKINAPLQYEGVDGSYFKEGEKCEKISESPIRERCDYSTTTASKTKPAKKILIVGDSHAEMWRPAIQLLGKRYGWNIEVYLYGGCPLLDARFEGPLADDKIAVCRTLPAKVDQIVAQSKPDLVFHAMFSGSEKISDGTARSQELIYQDALERTWTKWLNQGAKAIVPLLDPPLLEGDKAHCLQYNGKTPEKCATPLEEVSIDYPLTLAAKKLSKKIDQIYPFYADAFCDDKLCYQAVGGMPIYYDGSHLHRTYTIALSPRLDQHLKKVSALK